MTEWEKVISFESLYKAHRRARLGKRHKKEVIEFENNLSENLWQLHYDLKYGKYKIGGYHCFKIFDPKEREIQAISYRDRIVQHTLCDNYLSPLLEKYLIFDNCACRKDKGTKHAISRFRYFMCEHFKKFGFNGYFVKIDVKKYFPSINHDILKDTLKTVVKDINILNLLIGIIDSCEISENRGLPMGNQTSQCFALLYLNKFDRFFKELCQVKFYLRYMDDIIMIVNTKKEANYLLLKAGQLLSNLKLLINPKSQILPLKNGIQFLGWFFKFSETGRVVQKVKFLTKKRVLKKIKTLKLKVIRHKTLKEKILNTIVSYNGLFQGGNAYHFFYKLKMLLLN